MQNTERDVSALPVPEVKTYSSLAELLADASLDVDPETEQDPLLKLVGSGRGIWSGTEADAYVRSLRDDWE